MPYQHRHRYSHLENRVIWWKIKDLKNITCIILENKNNFWRKGKYIVFWLKIVILQRNGFFILLLPARVFLVVQKNRFIFQKFKIFCSGGKLVKYLRSQLSNFCQSWRKVDKNSKCAQILCCLIHNILSLWMGVSVNLDISNSYSASCYVDSCIVYLLK